MCLNILISNGNIKDNTGLMGHTDILHIHILLFFYCLHLMYTFFFCFLGSKSGIIKIKNACKKNRS